VMHGRKPLPAIADSVILSRGLLWIAPPGGRSVA
jgi:hypothetical protein